MNGVITTNGRAMIKVLPRCKRTGGRAACGFCGESDVRMIYSSPHNATLIAHCGVWQFVREGQAKMVKSAAEAGLGD